MTGPSPGQEGGVRSSFVADGDLHLTLNNTLSAVEDGNLEIVNHLAPLKIDPRVINRLEVVFEELVSNIVRHGFQLGSRQQIQVMVAVTPSAVDLTVEDDGVSFDPLKTAAPAPFKSLESATLGGLGIPLVIKLAASVRYETPELIDETADFRPHNRLFVTIAR